MFCPTQAHAVPPQGPPIRSSRAVKWRPPTTVALIQHSTGRGMPGPARRIQRSRRIGGPPFARARLAQVGDARTRLLWYPASFVTQGDVSG